LVRPKRLRGSTPSHRSSDVSKSPTLMTTHPGMKRKDRSRCESFGNGSIRLFRRTFRHPSRRTGLITSGRPDARLNLPGSNDAHILFPWAPTDLRILTAPRHSAASEARGRLSFSLSLRGPNHRRGRHRSFTPAIDQYARVMHPCPVSCTVPVRSLYGPCTRVHARPLSNHDVWPIVPWNLTGPFSA
jgi:hypothetical protein